jgi:Trm5-related predicted tRNA methylase
MTRPGSDTTDEVAHMRLEALSKLTGGRRLEMAIEMSRMARSFAESRIRREHPEWADRQVARELIRIAFYPADLPRGFE